MRGIIIGAGIGGLATAIALNLKGVSVDVFEAADALTRHGAGILIPPNAMAVLAQYQLADRVASLGHPIGSLCILGHQGMAILKGSAAYVNKGVQYHTIAIHRGVLQAILLDQLGRDKVTLSHRCHSVQNRADGAHVTFTNGSSRKAAFIIGADGIHSVVRYSIRPESVLRDSGQLCWRGVADIDLAQEWRSQLTELWGNGSRFGFVQIAPGQVYWYATVRQKNHGDRRDVTKEKVLALYTDYINPVAEIINHTAANAIIEDSICDVKPLASWYQQAIVLMGDAAHAATPNLGQGGAQAIEDSHTLAEKIATYKDCATAFEQFQRARIDRVNRIVKASWQIGQVSNVAHPWLCFARNTLLSGISSIALKKQPQMLYEWS